MSAMTEDGWAESKAAPGRKDTRRWCKGKVGREHVPQITLPSWAASWKTSRCAPPPQWWLNCPAGRDQLRRRTLSNWWCRHRETCSVCGKVLRFKVRREECPEYATSTPETP